MAITGTTPIRQCVKNLQQKCVTCTSFWTNLARSPQKGKSKEKPHIMMLAIWFMHKKLEQLHENCCRPSRVLNGKNWPKAKSVVAQPELTISLSLKCRRFSAAAN